MTRTRRAWERAGDDVRQRVAVGVLAATALVPLLLALASVLGAPAPATAALLSVVALAAVSELPLLQRRRGGYGVLLLWSESVLVVGLDLLPPGWAVLVLAGSAAAGDLVRRRPLRRALGNGAGSGLSAAAATAVVVALGHGGGHGVVSAGGFLALALGAAVYLVCNVATTAGLVAVAGRARSAEVVRDLLRAQGGLALLALNVGLAVAVLVLVELVPDVLLLLPPLAVLLGLLQRFLLHARQERDVWRQLEVATRELNRLEESEVVAAALHRARELFRCDAVELHLSTTALRPARVTALRPGATVPADLPVAGDEVALDGPGLAALSTTLSAPLETPSGRIGVLRLRYAGQARLTARERQVLLTFSHSVSTTLQNARLHADVRAEASRNADAARHDALTGLPNRVLLHEAVTQALAEDDGSTTALLLLDLDHFKQVNDTLGHEAGDALLQQVAARVSETVGAAGLVARLGGDEFAVLLPGLWSPRRAEGVAERLLAALAVPAELDGLQLASEVSIGIACHPQDADSAAGLLRRADVAMYQAKGTRGAWLRYDADRDLSSVAQLSLLSELRLALDRDEVVVHFQPQLDLRTGAVVSAEALCRWEHPERGMLLPGEFIPVVEQSGLVRPFTLRVLELALTACAAWNTGDGPRVRVAVNLAARSLLDAALPDDVALVLARTGVRAADLVLEITETSATSELEVVEEVLARLRHAGVEISVDDFGTGYSSLSFLQRSGVDEIKVDQGFVKGMLRSESDAALVRATVQLAHSLGARAVAEGVEDAAHARALRELGCDLAQGWHYAAAGPVEALDGMLRAQAAPVPAPRVVRLTS